MKHLHKITTSKILFFALIISFSLQAKVVGRVMDIKGNAFIVKKDGSTTPLKKNDPISDFSELITDETSQVSIADHYDHVFHMAPGTQVTLLNKILEIRGGKVWVQSFSTLNGYSVQTANAVSHFSDSEFILIYDSEKLSTQLMVISGSVKFGNLLEDHLNYEVKSGTFSFIDQEYEKGFPRVPTNIGKESFHQLVGLFKDVKSQNNSFAKSFDTPKKTEGVEALNREIASVTPEMELNVATQATLPPTTNSKMIFVRAKETLRLPASKEYSAGEYYNHMKNEITKEKKAKIFKGDEVKVRVFGEPFKVTHSPLKKVKAPAAVTQPQHQTLPQTQPRLPSSVAPIKVVETPVAINKEEGKEFESSLLKEYGQQQRHKNEVNDLIDELKSFSENYKKNY